jgi:hypothetical protein
MAPMHLQRARKAISRESIFGVPAAADGKRGAGPHSNQNPNNPYRSHLKGESI